MKHLLIFLIVLTVATGCKDDNETPEEINVAMLTSYSWANPTVTNDPDGDLSDQYSDLVIVFSKSTSGEFQGNMVIANGGIAFPESSSKWKFSSDFTQLILDSGKTYHMTLTKELLTLDFYVTPEGGRMNGLSGHFVFELHPQ